MREELISFSTLEDVVKAIRDSKNIIFITGAGVSVSCGIPDFRSKCGIYNTMEIAEIGIPSAELLFDLDYFQMDPDPFYKYAHKLMPADTLPSLSHAFIGLLEKKGKLLRNYTQNVDGLERKAGISQVIECHGSMDVFRCMKCRKRADRTEVEGDVLARQVPMCRHCKRGIMKPMITFFGEPLEPSVLRFMAADSKRCDLVVVMGTSLKVGGAVWTMLGQMPAHVPQILINLDDIPPPKDISAGFDVRVLGKCDDVTSFLAQALTWELKMVQDTDNDVPGVMSSAGSKSPRRAMTSTDVVNVECPQRGAAVVTEVSPALKRGQSALVHITTPVSADIATDSRTIGLTASVSPVGVDGMGASSSCGRGEHRVLRSRVSCPPPPSAPPPASPKGLSEKANRRPKDVGQSSLRLLPLACREVGRRVYCVDRCALTKPAKANQQCGFSGRRACNTGSATENETDSENNVLLSVDDFMKALQDHENMKRNMYTGGKKVGRPRKAHKLPEEDSKVEYIDHRNPGSKRKADRHVHEFDWTHQTLKHHRCCDANGAQDILREKEGPAVPSVGRSKRARVNKLLSTEEYQYY